MRLKDYGLYVYKRDPNSFHPFRTGKYLLFWDDTKRTQESISRISRHDAIAYLRWQKFWERAAAIFEPILLKEPPTFAEFALRYKT